MLLRIDNVLQAEEIARLREALAGAAFVDGRGTAGSTAAQAKHNLQLDAQSEAARTLGKVVLDALQLNGAFVSAALPRRISRPLFNRYAAGMTYGTHVDNAITWQPEPLRTDVAVTLFLSDPSDYQGGELCIDDAGFGSHRVKLAAGCLFLYPATALHRVAAVTRGTREAAIVWVQSMVRSAQRRSTLFELDRSIIALKRREPDAAELASLSAVYHNLLREWVEV
jgi:PKHD-type hydroxylase